MLKMSTILVPAMTACNLFIYKLWSIIKLALFSSDFSSRVFAAKECPQRLLNTWNRFLWRFCIVFSGANFYSIPFQLRDIVAQSRQVAGAVEHRCIFQDNKNACFLLSSLPVHTNSPNKQLCRQRGTDTNVIEKGSCHQISISIAYKHNGLIQKFRRVYHAVGLWSF